MLQPPPVPSSGTMVAMMCLLAASWLQLSVSAGSEWPHNALQHH